MKKLFKSMLVTVALCMPLVGCSSGTITDEQGAKWAEENGYVKVDSSSGATASSAPEAETDTTTSATEKKQGGVNYGAIEWDEPLQEAAIKEFLKGGKYIGDASLYQDDTGYNYREMYQMATVRNGKPVNTNLEMVLDASDLHLLAVIGGILEMFARCIVALVFVPIFKFDAITWADQSAWVVAGLYLLPMCMIILKHVEQQINIEKNYKNA